MRGPRDTYKAVQLKSASPHSVKAMRLWMLLAVVEFFRGYAYAVELTCVPDNLACVHGFCAVTGHYPYCFTTEDLCNGTTFCADSRDEGGESATFLDCGGIIVGTGVDTFLCGPPNSESITNLELLCDGVAHCSSGFDELNSLCYDKCLLPFYGGCDYSRRCASEETGVTCTVNDNTGPITIGWEFSVNVGTERAPEQCIDVCATVLNGEISTPLLLNYEVQPGTATASLDYTLMQGQSGEILISPNNPYGCITVHVLDDDIEEGPETFDILLSDPDGRPELAISHSLTSVRIFANDGPGLNSCTATGYDTCCDDFGPTNSSCYGANGLCFCDVHCHSRGDCCDDIHTTCPFNSDLWGDGDLNTCCQTVTNCPKEDGSCYCDQLCFNTGRCCIDLESICPHIDECPQGVPIVYDCPTNLCEAATCSLYPNAQCRPDYCGGCNARFFLDETEVTNQCLDSCAAVGHTTCCDASQSDCVGSNGVCHCDASCHQAGDCCSDIGSTCSLLDALMSSCGLVVCSYDACDVATCPAFPGAQCRPDPCVGCGHARFFQNGRGDVTDECGTSGPITMGDDPHFSIILPSGELLCYTVQGEHGFAFNLISSNKLHMNAMFTPDSRREEVTWLGSIGLVVKDTHYQGSNKTTLVFDAISDEIHIGDKVTLHAKHIEKITINGGKLTISEAVQIEPVSYPSVEVNLENAGLHFTIKFTGEHLDMFWHGVEMNDSNTHGLIGQFFRKGVGIDTVRKLLILPGKEPVPVMRRPVWSFMERETTDDQLCWTAMNPGYQGEGLIDGTYFDYVVNNILSAHFSYMPQGVQKI